MQQTRLQAVTPRLQPVANKNASSHGKNEISNNRTPTAKRVLKAYAPMEWNWEYIDLHSELALRLLTIRLNSRAYDTGTGANKKLTTMRPYPPQSKLPTPTWILKLTSLTPALLAFIPCFGLCKLRIIPHVIRVRFVTYLFSYHNCRMHNCTPP